MTRLEVDPMTVCLWIPNSSP